MLACPRFRTYRGRHAAPTVRSGQARPVVAETPICGGQERSGAAIRLQALLAVALAFGGFSGDTDRAIGGFGR